MDSQRIHIRLVVMNIFISGSPAVGGVDDSRYMFISTSNFNVKQDGSVTNSNFLLEGGTIQIMFRYLVQYK